MPDMPEVRDDDDDDDDDDDATTRAPMCDVPADVSRGADKNP
jgi:hypothetical protein